MLGKIEGKRRRGQQDEMVGGIIDLMDMSLNNVQELLMDTEGLFVAIHRVTKNQTRLLD